MNTITIPKKIAMRDDLVVIPKKEYEKLYRFWMSAEQITQRGKKAIEKGFREITQGKFLTSKQVRNELGL